MTLSQGAMDISVESARDGRPVLRRNGRLLASSIAPLKEAETWANGVLNSIEPGTTVVVLGLGCGYHIEALLRLSPEQPLLVIERDEQIAKYAFEICPSIPRFNVVIEGDWTKLADSMLVSDVLGGVFKICPHLPSVLGDRVFYGSVEAFLLGRDKTSFLMQIRSRPELIAHFDPEKIKALPDQTVSIKTIQHLFNSSSQTGGVAAPAESREQRIWKLLEELVK